MRRCDLTPDARRAHDHERDLRALADGTLEARFWAKVIKTPGCWVWTGTQNKSGYGHFNSHGVFPSQRVHVVAYALLVGPVPDGLELDHTCQIKLCVNPGHLEAVTHQVNVQRMHDQGCYAGHPWKPETTFVDGRGRRNCAVCRPTLLRRINA